MAKYEVTKAEAVPRQEALAGWPGNNKECGPPCENTQTIVSGPYPGVSIAQVAELHAKHVSMIADGAADLHAGNALYVMCHLKAQEINGKKVLCALQYRLDPGEGNDTHW